MNKLYQILYPGAYLPWCIVLIHYLFNMNICNLISAMVYVTISIMKLSHVEFYEKDVVFWNVAQKICEFALLFRLIILNITGSGLIGLVVAMIVCIVYGKTSKSRRMFMIQPPFYALTLLFLCSVSHNTIQIIATLILIILTIYQWKTVYVYNSLNDMEKNLYVHFNIKITEAYLIFVLEWANSPLHWMSLPIVMIISALFQANAIYNIPYRKGNYEEFYLFMQNLPKEYPIPLDFIHARAHCNIAKKVFKRHTI